MGGLSLLKILPLWVYPALALVCWTGCTTLQKHSALQKLEKQQAQVLKERAEGEALAREKEKLLGNNQVRVTDELAKARVEVVRAARTSDERLRALSAAWAASAASGGAGASCGNDGAPIVSVLRDEDRGAFVALGEEAEGIRVRLLACQSWARGVRQALTK
jgi:hypothetical protein